MKLISDIYVSGKRVFVRADLDVPIETTNDTSTSLSASERLTTNAEIATRLTNIKETVDYLLSKNAQSIIIAGHIDRPEKPDPSLSTKQLLEPLRKILGREMVFVPDIFPDRQYKTDPGAEEINGQRSDVVLLENLRFWPGEVANDDQFARQLAALADVYVNEAFGNCHRVHASMVTLPKLLPHAAGFHLREELEELSRLLSGPPKPFVAIVGGAKIGTKLPLVEHLAKIADRVLVGGELPHEIKEKGMHFASNVRVATLTFDGKDIDEQTQKTFAQIIAEAKTIVWNGPMGLFEEGYDKGSKAIAEAALKSGAYCVVGGGETTQFLAQKGLLAKFSFVSAGGGAMLEFLSGHKLPALEALL